MLHKNEIWLAEKVQSFRDFTEYYFTSRLNKTPESLLKVRSQFFFFNLLFYVRSMCCLVYLLSKHLSAQTLPNVRTQFRTESFHESTVQKMACRSRFGLSHDSLESNALRSELWKSRKRMTVLIVTEVFKPLYRVLKKKKNWIWCLIRFGAFPSFKRPTCAFEVSFFRDKNRLENIGTCFLLNLHREHRASYAPQIFMRLAFLLAHLDFEIFQSSLAKMIRFIKHSRFPLL